jgi:hypothetical protein
MLLLILKDPRKPIDQTLELRSGRWFVVGQIKLVVWMDCKVGPIA